MFKITAKEKQFILERRKVKAGKDSLWNLLIYSNKENTDKLRALMKVIDPESKKLMQQIDRELRKLTMLEDVQIGAVNRFLNMLHQAKGIDGADARNRIFKIANDLKIKLPSASF